VWKGEEVGIAMENFQYKLLVTLKYFRKAKEYLGSLQEFYVIASINKPFL
jgi:hypothetical protein